MDLSHRLAAIFGPHSKSLAPREGDAGPRLASLSPSGIGREERPPRLQNRQNIEIEIQELVLVDVPVADQTELQQVITAELVRLLQQRGIPGALTQATQVPLRQGADLSPSSSQAEPLGVEIAQSIYSALGGGPGV